MPLLYSEAILIGIVRFICWILLFYTINRLFFFRKAPKHGLHSAVEVYANYMPRVIVLSLVLVAFGAFDMFTLVALAFLAILFQILELAPSTRLRSDLIRRKRSVLIHILKDMHQRSKGITSWRNLDLSRLNPGWSLIVATIIMGIALIYRFYLLRFDDYQLSAQWLEQINKYKDVLEQHWFVDNLTMSGEYIIMNLYGLITGISPAIALQSFGILTSALMAIMVYWFSSRITGSREIIGVLAGMIFAVFFTLFPFHPNRITQSYSMTTALSLLLPAMMFAMKPVLQTKYRNGFSISMVLLFFACGLINLYCYLILTPPFLLLGFFFLDPAKRSYLIKVVKAYGFAGLALLVISLPKVFLTGQSVEQLYLQNMISIDSYIDTSYMLLNINQLIIGMHVIGLAAFVLAVTRIKQQKKYRMITHWIAYINLISLVYWVNVVYIDRDIFLDAAVVLYPITVGVYLYVFIAALIKKSVQSSLFIVRYALIIIGVSLAASLVFQKNLFIEQKTEDRLSEKVITAYQKANNRLLPYSYAVVDRESLFPLSRGKHLYMNYETFAQEYPVRDSIANLYKRTDPFFIDHPEYILPSSLLVFDYSATPIVRREDFEQRSRLARQTLAELKQKGRNVRIFYQGDGLTVYELVNEANKTYLKDLL